MIDYLIVTPTDEEFKQLSRILFRDAPPGKQVGSITYYIHRHRCEAGEALIVALSMGRMGQSWSGLIAYEAIRLWKPVNVIQVGIAGRLPKGPPKGDVIVPGYVLGYEIASVSQIQGELRFSFRPTGDRPQLTLLNSARAFCSDPLYRTWRNGAYQLCEEALQHAGVPSPPLPTVHIGEKLALASGNFVVKTERFGSDLQDFSTDLKAVEMEAKGLLSAIELLDAAVQIGHADGARPSALLVRGISDDADPGKEQEEARTGGVYRTTSMRAAALFVMKLIEYRLANPDDSQIRADPLELDPKNSANVPVAVRMLGLPHLGDGCSKWAFDPVFAVRRGSSALSLELKLLGTVPGDLEFHTALRQSNTAGWSRNIAFKQDQNKHTWKWAIERSPDGYSLLFGLVANTRTRFQLSIKDEFGRKSSWSSPL